MNKNEHVKKFVEVYSGDNCVYLTLWDDKEKICYVPLSVRPDEEKYYDAPSETGEMVSCIEPDFLDDFVPKLWDIHDDGMKTNDEIIISSFENAEQGKGIYMSVDNGRATINFSMDGNDNIFEVFSTADELQSFIFNLENTIEEAKKEE